MTTTIAHGKATIATTNTPQVLSANTDGIFGLVTLSAPSGNTGTIYVGAALDDAGNALASTNGYPIPKGTSIQIPLISLANLQIVGTQNDVLNYIRIRQA